MAHGQGVLSPYAVPEPSTVLLLGTAGVAAHVQMAALEVTFQAGLFFA